MAPFVALALASAIAPAAGASPPEQGGHGAMTSARASARILPAASIWQGQDIVASGPAVQINRRGDGTMLVEFL